MVEISTFKSIFKLSQNLVKIGLPNDISFSDQECKIFLLENNAPAKTINTTVWY